MFGRTILRHLLSKPYAAEEVNRFYDKLNSGKIGSIAELVFAVLDSVEDGKVDRVEIESLKRRSYTLLLDLGLDTVVRDRQDKDKKHGKGVV